MKSRFKVLFDLFQKIDYRDKENSGKKKMTGILTAYLFSNTILSLNFYSFFNEKSFIILTFTSNLFLISIIVLNEFDNLFLALKSYDVFAVLPFSSKDIFLPKFLSAAVYIFYFILASSVPQLIFFYQYDHNIFKTAFYLFTNLFFCYSVITSLVFIYLLILNYFTGKAHILLNFLQILFFIFVFYSSTLSSKFKDTETLRGSKSDILELEFLKFFPQTFFSNSVYDYFYFLICFVSTVLLLYLLFYYLSNNYLVLLEKVKTYSKIKKSSRGNITISFPVKFVKNYLLSNNYEIASYNLVNYQIKNSRFLRIKYIPVAVMPLMMTVIGLISNLPQLLFFSNSSGNNFFATSIMLLSPSITMTLLMSARLLVSNTKILDDDSSDTFWIYENLPVKDKRQIILGANKYVYINYILPVIILIFICISFKADMLTCTLNILFVSVSVYFISTVGTLFDNIYPFTLESTKFNSASKFLEIIMSMIFGVALFLIQIFIFQNIIFVIIYIFAIIIITALLNRN